MYVPFNMTSGTEIILLHGCNIGSSKLQIKSNLVLKLLVSEADAKSKLYWL